MGITYGDHLSNVREAFAEAIRIAKEERDDPPEGGYDSGATRDGWEMACKVIAARIEAVAARS